jgi:nucleoside-diphosphate-sugar epimerase
MALSDKQETLFARPHQVLVTGGTGFVGSHLVEKLVRRGYRVRLLIRRTSSLHWLEGVPVEYAYGDVRDKASLAGACVGVRSIFHLGGVVRARAAGEFQQVNAQGTRNLAEALAERGLPGGFFVYCSSLSAGGPAVAVERDPEPVRTESDPPTPVTAYGRSKLDGEIALREVADSHGRFRHVVLRPPAVYGPRDQAVLPLFLLIRHGLLPVPRTPVTRLSVIYVHDLVDGLLRAAETGVRGTYYVSDGATHRWEDVGLRMAELMDTQVRVVRVSHAVAWLAGAVAESWGFLAGRPAVLDRARIRDIWQPHWVCSSEKARRDWGFAPEFPLERGLEETLKWYRLNQWL